jgi:hypothetical protein
LSDKRLIRVERTMAAITAYLKTKDLAQRISHSLLSTSFMKFRGPAALKDRWNEKASGPDCAQAVIRDCLRRWAMRSDWVIRSAMRP